MSDAGAQAPAGPFATLPSPPYYAVIFSSLRSAADEPGYAAMADRMVALASERPGFLGVESARGADGFGITVSYWASEEAIRAWRADAEHRIARETGRSTWYVHYELRVARVERAYGLPAHRRDPAGNGG
jgi:heme-degrading monooxygenase HmoA